MKIGKWIKFGTIGAIGIGHEWHRKGLDGFQNAIGGIDSKGGPGNSCIWCLTGLWLGLGLMLWLLSGEWDTCDCGEALTDALGDGWVHVERECVGCGGRVIVVFVKDREWPHDGRGGYMMWAGLWL